MHADYYQNILYPLQDKVLKTIGQIPVEFYLTGGTALGRAYLNHRYSDDLDFFINGVSDFKQQLTPVINALTHSGLQLDTSVVADNYARLFIISDECTLKLDFVNDVTFRTGVPVVTNLFIRTDN